MPATTTTTHAAASGPGHHTFSLAETSAFSSVLNSYLGRDATLAARLPLDTQTTALFEACADGVLLCKLIALVDSDSVDVRAVNMTKLSKFKIIENNNLAINAAADIGCRVTNIGANDLIEASPHLILGLLWQIIRLLLTKKVTLKQHPELARLLEGEEALRELLALEPEKILVRWVNYHLTRAGSARRIKKLGKELSDSEVYATLMTQLYGARLPAAVDLSAAPEARAAKVLDNARAVGVEPFIKPADIVSGNSKLNLSFVAELFNDCPGLAFIEEAEKAALGLAELDAEDASDTREARTFKLWLNSLGLVDKAEHGGDGGVVAPIHDFYSELCHSVPILRTMDVVEPGTVEWRKVNRDTSNRHKKIANANHGAPFVCARESG